VTAVQHHRQKLETDTELLELDGHAVQSLWHGDGEFAAREKLGFLTRERRQGRLGEDFRQPLLLGGIDGHIEEEVTAEIAGEQSLILDQQIIRCELIDGRTRGGEAIEHRDADVPRRHDQIGKCGAAIDAATTPGAALLEGIEARIQPL
jgi:hypothetical protein